MTQRSLHVYAGTTINSESAKYFCDVTRVFSPASRDTETQSCSPVGLYTTPQPNSSRSTEDSTPCGLGYYSLQGEPLCTPCPAGYRCPQARDSPIACDPGYYRCISSGTPPLWFPNNVPARKSLVHARTLNFRAAVVQFPFTVIATTTWLPHSCFVRSASVCPICHDTYVELVPLPSTVISPLRLFPPSPRRTRLPPLGLSLSLLSPVYVARLDATHRTSSTAASTNCTSCPAGYFCDDPEAPPQPCEVGYYSGGGTAICEACQPGYRCPEASVSATPAGSECPEGTYCNPARTLLECPAGTYGEGLRTHSILHIRAFLLKEVSKCSVRNNLLNASRK